MGEDQTIDVTAPISELESSTGVKSGIGDENTPDLVTITSQELGYLYRVLRHHRKERGKITILESNY